jgi:hypothetical protein
MTKYFIWVCVVTLAGLVLASCATMTPEECKVADWREVGLRDGLNGQTLAHLNSRAEDCQKAGVAIHTPAYLAGRDAGLRSYCRLENAVPLGLNGGTYEGVCPANIDGQFRQRFEVARNVYDLRSEVSSLDARIESLERRLRGTNHDEEKRLKEAPSEEERKKIRKALEDERRDIHADLGESDRRLRRKRDELRYAEQALGALR